MNKDTLTLLGCSSLAVMLLTSHSAANANTIAPQNVGQVEIEFKAPNADKVNPLAQENTQPDSQDLMSDTIGDKAVEEYGCDCTGCRNQVLSMVHSSKIRTR